MQDRLCLEARCKLHQAWANNSLASEPQDERVLIRDRRLCSRADSTMMTHPNAMQFTRSTVTRTLDSLPSPAPPNLPDSTPRNPHVQTTATPHAPTAQRMQLHRAAHPRAHAAVITAHHDQQPEHEAGEKLLLCSKATKLMTT